MTAGEAVDVAAAWQRLAERPGDAAPVHLDGFHALKHALRFGADVRFAVATDRAATLALAAELAPDLTGPLDALLVDVTPAELAGMVARPHPTGVAALAARPPVPSTGRPRTAPLVVLDNPRHLGNTGAVIRLAAGVGAAGVLTTGTVDPWNPGVVRAAAGLHYALPVARCEVVDLPVGPLFALDPEGADIRDLRLPDDALLAFGSERHGLSAAVRARADRLVALPMRSQVSSYNLATSVSMALYHWLAQQPRRPAAGPAVGGE